MELTKLSLREVRDLIANGEVTAHEVTDAYLARIARLNPQINCFITQTVDLARAQAQAADEISQRGGARGPLHGIPLAVKDLFETKGIRTTAGSWFFKDYIPDADCFVVRKLYDAGGVILGKLNMHEWAYGVTNENSHYGDCKNPWDPARSPGGSSGGSGAALAADLCLGALGSDTGGSVRIPASLCGIPGLKPTYGRVSLSGAIPLSWHQDHVGPMARRVEDLAILLGVIAAYDPQDPYCVDRQVDDYLSDLSAGVGGMRAALASDEYFMDAEDQVIDAVQSAAQAFEDLGAKVETVPFDGGRDAFEANRVMLFGDAAAYHGRRMAEAPERFGADVRARLEKGAGISASEYALARHAQTRLRLQFDAFFQQYDLLLTPTTPVSAPRRRGGNAVEKAGQLTKFTAPFNLTGLPALSVPCGFTKEGLPIGLQIVTRAWGEAHLLQAGHAYEQLTAWYLRKPPLEPYISTQ